jgi:hypothetical protein
MLTKTIPTAERRALRSDGLPRRTAALVAGAGGGAWLVLAADSIVRGGAHRYRDALFLVPWTLMALTYVTVHQRQRHRSRTWERWGIRALVSSMTLMAVGQVHVVAADADRNLAFPLAPLLFALGSLTFGIGTVQAGVLPLRAGVMIAASQFLTVALAGALSPWVPLSDYGNYSGAAMHGVMLLVVAAALRVSSKQPAVWSGSVPPS